MKLRGRFLTIFSHVIFVWVCVWFSLDWNVLCSLFFSDSFRTRWPSATRWSALRSGWRRKSSRRSVTTASPTSGVWVTTSFFFIGWPRHCEAVVSCPWMRSRGRCGVPKWCPFGTNKNADHAFGSATWQPMGSFGVCALTSSFWLGIQSLVARMRRSTRWDCNDQSAAWKSIPRWRRFEPLLRNWAASSTLQLVLHVKEFQFVDRFTWVRP